MAAARRSPSGNTAHGPWLHLFAMSYGNVPGSQTPPIDLRALSSILLIRLRSLGDTVLMTPVVSALRRWRPDLHIAALVESRFAAVLHGNPKLDEVIEAPAGGFGFLGGLSAKRAAVAAIRRHPYDLALNLHGGTTSLLYTRLARSRYTVGSVSYRYPFAYGLRAPAAAEIWRRTALHTVENQLAPLQWLGIPVTPLPDLEVFVASTARARIGSRLEALGLADRPFVLIHPTATLFTKQWAEEKFSRLVDHIASTYRLPVVLTVSGAERSVAQRIQAGTTTKPAVLDALSLSDLMAVIERAALFIGCDSGPAHIASALKKKVVVIFGSSNAVAWRPWQTTYELVQSGLPCNPCPGYRCYAFDAPRCIFEISVDTVAAAVARILN